MILLIDNYDSFTYNLYQVIGLYHEHIQVVRNDEISLAEIKSLNPSHIIISPGPGFPKDAGISIDIIKNLYTQYPILGICLGHQAICQAFGGKITHAKKLMHGKQSNIHIANGNPLFRGLPPIIKAGRYHSLGAEKESLPNDLLITAEDEDGEIMAVQYRNTNVFGVQFHPESILTEQGNIMIQNFCNLEVSVQ